MDAAGRRLVKARLPEGVTGMARLHAMIGEQLGKDAEETEVVIGIETDRGPWVRALIAAGYTVFAVNPLSVARYRERHSVSGAKSDAVASTPWPTWCAHRLPPAARGRGRQRRSRSGQGGHAGAQDADPGTHPPPSGCGTRCGS